MAEQKGLAEPENGEAGKNKVEGGNTDPHEST
jgi:hypothetical protein